MTAQEALNEVGKVNEQLQVLDGKLLCATSDPGSEAVPQLHQEIAEAMVRKEWLLGQIQRMQKVGSSVSPPVGAGCYLISFIFRSHLMP